MLRLGLFAEAREEDRMRQFTALAYRRLNARFGVLDDRGSVSVRAPFEVRKDGVVPFVADRLGFFPKVEFALRFFELGRNQIIVRARAPYLAPRHLYLYRVAGGEPGMITQAELGHLAAQVLDMAFD